MLRAIAALAVATALNACTGPDFPNTVHPDHAEELARVNTTEKATAFFSDMTYVRRIGREEDSVLRTLTEIIEYKANASSVASYFAPDGAVFTGRNNTPTVTVGQWRVKKTPRGYPQLCYNTHPNGDEGCIWPSGLFRQDPDRQRTFRGDVFNLTSRRAPLALRAQREGETLASLVARHGIRSENLSTLSLLPEKESDQAEQLATDHRAFRSALANTTIRSFGSGHGNQLEYIASDGTVWLWYPGNGRILTGEWKTEARNRDGGTSLCFGYGTNSFNPVTGVRGGEWECVEGARWLRGLSEQQSGDVLGLRTAMPFVLTRDERTIAELKSMAQ